MEIKCFCRPFRSLSSFSPKWMKNWYTFVPNSSRRSTEHFKLSQVRIHVGAVYEKWTEDKILLHTKFVRGYIYTLLMGYSMNNRPYALSPTYSSVRLKSAPWIDNSHPCFKGIFLKPRYFQIWPHYTAKWTHYRPTN